MFPRNLSRLLIAAATLLGMNHKRGTDPVLAAVRAKEYNLQLPAIEPRGSGGHRSGRSSRGAGISGAGLWRKCRAGERVRGW